MARTGGGLDRCEEVVWADTNRAGPAARGPVRRLRGVRPGAVVGERFVYPLPRGGAADRRSGGGQSALGWGPGTLAAAGVLASGSTAAQDGPGQRAIAVPTLAFAPVKRAIPRVRLGPAGEAACRPPASRGEGAEGTAFVRPMRPPANPGTGRGRACSGWAKGERGHGDRGPGAARIDER